MVAGFVSILGCLEVLEVWCTSADGKADCLMARVFWKISICTKPSRSEVANKLEDFRIELYGKVNALGGTVLKD